MNKQGEDKFKKLLRDGKIDKEEYNRRSAQRAISRATAGMAGRRGAALRDSLLERLDRDYFHKSFVANLGAIFSPQDFEGVKVYDPLMLVPSDSQLFKTEFTVAPSATGSFSLAISASMKEVCTVFDGVVRFLGLSYYPLGPNGSIINVFKYTEASAMTLCYRSVGQSVIVSYEGSTLNDSGSVAWTSVPQWRNPSITPLTTYSDIASYDYAKTGPARETMYMVSLPCGSGAMQATSEPQYVRGEGWQGLRIAGEALQVSGTYPATEARLRVVVYNLFEVFSVDPFVSGTIGSPYDHPQAAVAAHQAAAHIIKKHSSHGSGLDFGSVLRTAGSWAAKEGASMLKSYGPSLKKYALEMAKDAVAAAPLALMAL
jgi:hypothetical protein